jgi:hypothetical protein
MDVTEKDRDILARTLWREARGKGLALIHAWLYCQDKLSLTECDALFYEMLLVKGADLRRAQLMFSELRIGAWYRYNQCAGGVKVEDLAFELMSSAERAAWQLQLSVIHQVADFRVWLGVSRQDAGGGLVQTGL